MKQSLLIVCMVLTFQLFGQYKKNHNWCITHQLAEKIYLSNPNSKEKFESDKKEGNLLSKNGKTSVIEYIIPTVVHIMHNNGPENISDEKIMSQFDILNEDFGKYGSGYNNDSVGADTKIRFCLATIDPYGNPTTGINRVSFGKTSSFNVDNDEAEMKALSRWDPEKYMNIWIVNTINDGSVLGYTYYPSSVAEEDKDGLVIRYDTFGRIGNEFGFIGRTVTHETGHYLNLIHTWGDGDCFIDDGIEDTPLCADPYYSDYPACDKPFQCNNDRMIENYMDYSDDSCMNVFTNQQAVKMQNAIVKYRKTLVSESNLEKTGCINCTSCDTIKYEKKVHIYPNPASDYLVLYFDFKKVNTLVLRIFDARGKIVLNYFKDEISRGPLFINTSSYLKGIYFVTLNSEEVNDNWKFVIAE